MFTNSTGSDIISAHDFMKLRVRHPALASSTQPTPMVQERPPSPQFEVLAIRGEHLRCWVARL